MRRALVLPAAALILVLGACTGGATTKPPGGPRPVQGGGISFGVLGSPATLDPYSPVASDLTRALVTPLYPSLFAMQPDGRVRPELAVGSRLIHGGMRIRLRRATWSDGSPITAEDVVASVRRARPPSGFARVRSARAMGDRELVLRGRITTRDVATAAYVLPGGRPQPPGGRFGGPFELTRVVPGLRLDYRPNARWTGDGPYLHRLNVFFVESLDEMLALLDKRRLDAAAVPSAVTLGYRLDALDVVHDSALGWSSIRLDMRWIDSRRRRVSIARGLMRSTIEEGVVRDGGRIADRLDPGPGPGGASGPFSTLPSGGGSTGPVRLAAPAGDEQLLQIARIARQQLSGAGFAVQLLAVEARTLYGPWQRHPRAGAILERVAGAPGLRAPRDAWRTLEAFPMLQVRDYLAYEQGIHGLAVNPTMAGPLWNCQGWWTTHRPEANVPL